MDLMEREKKKKHFSLVSSRKRRATYVREVRKNRDVSVGTRFSKVSRAYDRLFIRDVKYP